MTTCLKTALAAVQRIQTIPKQLLNDEEHHFLSFDVILLFTHVPLDKTIKEIINIIFKGKIIDVTLKKNTLKKMIRDVCKNTVFSFNDQLYTQIDGASMGSALGYMIV